MKIKFHHIAWLLPLAFFAGCKKDNYAPPGSTLQGKIVYQGDPIPVGYDNVTFELWQSGWGKLTPIDVKVAQDGSYSALLFDGDYKLIIPAGQGPFRSLINPKSNSDTIPVHVQGDQTLDIEVMPYYMIRDPKFAISDSTVTATCKLEKIITDANAKDVEKVELYISKTQFVDDRTSISGATVNGADITDMNNISLSAKVPAMIPTQHYVFVRVGVKISNVEDKIFSPVQKLEF